MDEKAEHESMLEQITDKIRKYTIGGYTGFEAVTRQTEIVHDIAELRKWWNIHGNGAWR